MSPFLQLAPMEGVLDANLRAHLDAVGGLDVLVTEFIRITDQVLPPHVFYRYCPELKTAGKTATGTPVFVQLLGSRPDMMAANARRAVELGALGIDLNFGCPAKTVNRHDGGAKLLEAPIRVETVVAAVRQAVPSHIPVTAKVRLGFAHKDFHLDIARAAEAGGAQRLVVHARTKLEMYTPPAHWQYVARMRRAIQIPVLANGDIWTVADYKRCCEVSEGRDVALGRGIVRNPGLAQAIRGEESWSGKSDWDFLNSFHQVNVDQRGPTFALARLKQILRYWSDRSPSHQDWFDSIKRRTDNVDLNQISRYP